MFAIKLGPTAQIIPYLPLKPSVKEAPARNDEVEAQLRAQIGASTDRLNALNAQMAREGAAYQAKIKTLEQQIKQMTTKAKTTQRQSTQKEKAHNTMLETLRSALRAAKTELDAARRLASTSSTDADGACANLEKLIQSRNRIQNELDAVRIRHTQSESEYTQLYKQFEVYQAKAIAIRNRGIDDRRKAQQYCDQLAESRMTFHQKQCLMEARIKELESERAALAQRAASAHWTNTGKWNRFCWSMCRPFLICGPQI